MYLNCILGFHFLNIFILRFIKYSILSKWIHEVLVLILKFALWLNLNGRSILRGFWLIHSWTIICIERVIVSIPFSFWIQPVEGIDTLSCEELIYTYVHQILGILIFWILSLFWGIVIFICQVAFDDWFVLCFISLFFINLSIRLFFDTKPEVGVVNYSLIQLF